MSNITYNFYFQTLIGISKEINSIFIELWYSPTKHERQNEIQYIVKELSDFNFEMLERFKDVRTPYFFEIYMDEFQTRLKQVKKLQKEFVNIVEIE